jgi:hypothetical protein
LVFVLLVSVGMSWLAAKMERARRQKEAVEAIEGAGGLVTYDYQTDDRDADPPVATWLQRLLGQDFFFDVVDVSVYVISFGDDEMVYLTGLGDLESLNVYRVPITDSGLSHFNGMTNLHVLGLQGTQITDHGLEHLGRLRNLSCLILSDTKITDAGLERLKGLSSLNSLDVVGTQVTPEGVKKLQEALPDCEIVY